MVQLTTEPLKELDSSVLRGERSAASAASCCVGIRKSESGTHHAGDIVDLNAIQILRAKHIDEQFDAVLIQDEITLS